MKTLQNYLNMQLDNCIDVMKYFESKEDIGNAIDCEKHIEELKKQLDVLSIIIEEKEGNILNFNSDGEFNLICFRVTDMGEQIIETYSEMFTTETYDDVLESAKCYDITSEFNIDELFDTIICTDDLFEFKTGVYYFVTDETLTDFLLANPENVNNPTVDSESVASEEKIVSLKNFKAGNTAYALQENFGTTKKPYIYKVDILSVGRKYVVINTPHREKYMDCGKNFLRQDSAYGEAKLLFLNERDAMDYLEKKRLLRWFSNLSQEKLLECSLAQLRQAKELLEVKEQEEL